MARAVHFLCFLLCFYFLYTQTNAGRSCPAPRKSKFGNGRSCFDKGKSYQDGEEWQYNMCQKCSCRDGRKKCVEKCEPSVREAQRMEDISNFLETLKK